ncbi:MAG: SBBP repeat-containing protein [Acidobacteriota bacterium]
MKKSLRRPISLMLILSILSIFVILPANLEKVPQMIAFADSPMPSLAVDATAQGIAFKKMPLRFEANRGQTDAEVRFIAKTSDSTLFLTASEAVLRLPKLRETPETKDARRKAMPEEIIHPVESAVIGLRPINSNREPRIIGIDKLPGVSNYFIGNDPRKWRANVEAYAKVKYENLYPGIDLIYYCNEAGELEYDFKVAVGANPGLIAMSVEGADRVELDHASGGLILNTAVGRLRQHAPRIYQEINGKRQEIAGQYKLVAPPSTIQNPKSKIQNPLVAFELGEYDESKPLVIDPVVVYSTLLGGAAGNFDGAYDVAVDAEGNAYIIGTTQSSDFPTRNPIDGTKANNSSNKAFISKFAPDGSLIFSTFFGGNDSGSRGNAIALDATGAIYIAGATAASDFPIRNAFQSTQGGSLDAFVAKLTSDGTGIIYSSFLGGNQIDEAKDLKLDAQNNAYLIGTIDGRGATSVTFPTVNPTQANYGGGDRDMFLSVVSATGTSLLFSTFSGGNGDEEASSVSVSSDGNQIVIVGASDSTNLTTGGIALQATDPSCDELENILQAYSIGDSGYTDVRVHPTLAIAAIQNKLRDRLGREPTCVEILEELYDRISPPDPLMGQLTGSAVYPPGGSGLVSPSSVAPQATGGGYDVVVAPVDQNGNGSAKGIFGGSRDEFTSASAKDSRGAIYITGDTNSTDLPTVSPTQSTPGGVNENGFVVVFAPDTYDVLFATYLGGDGVTLPQGIAVDPQGNIFVSGIVTDGSTFPTTTGAFQRELKGSNDAFLVKYSPVTIPTGPDFSLSFSQPTVTTSFGKVKIAADINRTGGFTGNVTITAATPLPRGIVLVGDSVSTTESRVNFKLKVKGSAALGQHLLTFQARDDSGRTRTATLTLIVQ